MDVRRRSWLTATVVCTVGAFAVTIASAPTDNANPARGLQWLLFVTSSVHVASTGWFFTMPEVRAYAGRHRGRYVWVPAALVIGTALVALVVPPARFTWLLLGFFAWQFFHFQKQNLGMAALAGASAGIGSVSLLERRALIAAGAAGIAGLTAHPRLLQLTLDARIPWAFPFSAAAFALSVIVGLAALARRTRRTAGYVTVYVSSLLFFLPVFVFTNPYAAVAGLVVAHGGQYLVIVGLIALAKRNDRTRVVSLGLLLNVALIGGLALNAASHLHGAQLAGRAVYGAYLGAVMGHFVVDAGLWRLRDSFPRTMLMASVPYLLVPSQPPPQEPAAPDAGSMVRPTMSATIRSRRSAEAQRS
ncbi:hypothetical protein acdb102_40640 [Acidothermaceae bacterium B102]|nr:hypothetical protein acdb102_40640 [Acidothermaceae bacterium B102]